MGYSTHIENGIEVLSCDYCGARAKKYKCPFGYCQPLALCRICAIYQKYEGLPIMSKDAHVTKGCEESHNKYKLDLIEREALIDAGNFIRCSALQHDNPDRIKVIFRGKNFERAFFMNEKTYHSFPLGENVTCNDYASKGEIIETENLDIYQNK